MKLSVLVELLSQSEETDYKGERQIKNIVCYLLSALSQGRRVRSAESWEEIQN